MKILLLSRYSQAGASSRVRFYQYLPELARLGIAVHSAPLFDDDYLRDLYTGRRPSPVAVAGYYARRLAVLGRLRGYDLVWLEYELLPSLPFGEQALALAGVPYLVDYDDAIFHRYDRSPRRLVRVLLGRKIDRVMRGAALVTAGNDYLAARARAAGARQVECLPSVVDLDRYAPRPPQSSTEPLTVGWIGTPVTARYLEQIADPLRAVARQRPLRLLAVGAGPLAMAGVEVECQPWSEATEVALIRRMDIGIMPLADTPWEQGKCGYKLIQYMACGVPVIASPVGVNSRLVAPGDTGLLAATPSAWVEALLALGADPARREILGGNGRRLVAQQYSLQQTAPLLAGLLRRAARREDPACAE